MPSFTPGRWNARWIWGPRTKSRGRRVVALRRRFHVDSVADEVPCRLWADSRYVLWVGTREVARGPVRINPRRAVYDAVDLAPYLHPGENVVGALVWLYDSAVPWWMPAPTFASGVSGGAFVLEAQLEPGEWLVTDASWRARALSGWGADPAAGVTGRGRERIDLAALPVTWLGPEFDDADWEPARELRGHGVGEPARAEPPSYPFALARERDLSWPARTQRSLSSTKPGIWEAGEVVFGQIVVDLEAPAGTEVSLTAREFTDEAASASALQESLGATIRADGTRRRVELLDAYGFRTIEVEAPEGARVHGIEVAERTFPVTGDAWFECSDELLNRVWAVGRRTVSLCSLDAYLDCPTREQRAWTGDSVVHQMVDLTTNADWSLARWHPRLAASPRADGMLPMAVAGDAEHSDMTVIPDWALHWVHSVWNLYRYVGYAEVESLLPVAEGVLRWFEPWVDDDGLPVDVPGWVIIDWASVYTEGNCAALCGLWGRALLEFAEMAEAGDDRGRASWARATHARLATGAEALWDPERERYADSRVAGRLRPMASQHAQAAAIVGRLAPEDRWPRLVELLTTERDLVHATFSRADGPAAPGSNATVGGDYLLSGPPPEPWWDVERQLVRAQPFFRYVVHDALAAAGRSDLIAPLCRDWRALLERCPTSWGETWFGGTVSHGWASTPTRDLMTRVLGVEPAAPGFSAVGVEPALGDLAWARGAVPCPGGTIRVDADRHRVRVTSPLAIHHRDRQLPPGTHEIERPA